MLIKGELRYIEILKSRGDCNKDKLDEIEEALKRGKKYEAIVKDLENLDFMPNKDKLHFNWEDFNSLMNKFKQKYFPKPKTIYEKHKDKIISDSERLDIMGMKKFKEYYYYVGAIDALLEMKKITKEEHFNLSNIIQKNLKEG